MAASDMAVPAGHSPRTVHGSRRLRRGDELDDKSKRIIEALQVDGRQTYAEIGKAVGLSEAAVRQRVGKLLKSGAMQIVAVTDPLELGFARQAMIGVKVTGEIPGIADAIAHMVEVDYVVITAGTFDILAEVVCTDDEELFTLLNRIRAVPGVTSTETMMYMSLWNQRYNWGTR